MSRNLDSTLSAHLTDGVIQPAFFGSFQFRSGVSNAWSGVGDFTWGGLTFKGVGDFGQISAITEGTEVQADGMTVQIANLPFTDPSPTAPSVPSPYKNAALNTTSTASTDVSLSVTTGDLLVVLAYNNLYAVSPPVPPIGINDTQGNTWTVDQTTTAAYIGGTGVGWCVAHTTATATGTITVTVTGSTGSDTGILLVDTGANAIDAVGLVAGSIAWSSLTPTATTTASNQWALVLDIEEALEWFSDKGTEVFVANGPGHPFAHVWQFQTGGSGAVSATLTPQGYGPDNFPGAAIVVMRNPLGTPVLDIQEDIQMGAPAKLWFGLMQNGQLLGTPYLIFSGMVDQPTIDVDTQTISTTLALESRLTNLARPSGRRYTSADQRLYYPDDTGFQWVEMLNDLALRWGS